MCASKCIVQLVGRGNIDIGPIQRPRVMPVDDHRQSAIKDFVRNRQRN